MFLVSMPSVFLSCITPFKEQKVSMIPGALTKSQFEKNLQENKYDESTVVVSYCTLGIRSGNSFANDLDSIFFRSLCWKTVGEERERRSKVGESVQFQRKYSVLGRFSSTSNRSRHQTIHKQSSSLFLSVSSHWVHLKVHVFAPSFNLVPAEYKAEWFSFLQRIRYSSSF